jgi:DNA-binding NtrC family response regulator
MLLRAIEQGEIRPVGARSPTRVDVRLIAATNRDLKRALEREEFLPDMYDRLDEVVLEIPPLRARREDIPLLVEHFVAFHSRRHGVEVRPVTPEAWRVLRSHPWPGNVRELGKAVSRAVIFAGAGGLRPQDFQLRGVNGTSAPARDQLPAASEMDGPDLPSEGAAVGGGTRGATGAALSWLQREALRILSERHEVRRRDFIARCRVSREVARRELTGLVRLGLLRRVGLGRATRYVPLSFGITWVSDALEWALALV